MNKNTFNASFTAQVIYETKIINPDGSVAKHRAPKTNLILDNGLNWMMTCQFAWLTQICEIGTDSTPTKKDSGGATATQSGTTVTSSQAFFESGDVGRLLKYDSGEEYYITAFTNDTTVTVDTSDTKSATQFTIYSVNQNGLLAPTRFTTNYITGSGNNSTTYSNGTVEYKRTFLFPQESTGITYNEVGWGPRFPVAGSIATDYLLLGSPRFGRDVIDGGDILTAGQQYQVIVRLRITFSPVVPTPLTDIGNNGFNTTGDYMYYALDLTRALTSVDSNGNKDGDGRVEPFFNDADAFQMYIRSSSGLTLPANTLTVETTVGGLLDINSSSADNSVASYVSGTYYRDKTFVFSPEFGNTSTVYGLVFGRGASSTSAYTYFAILFDNPQEKLNTHRLTVTLRYTCGRVLTNT